MDIDDILFESYDYQSYLEAQDQKISSDVSKLKSGTNSKNILQKLWAFIKKYIKIAYNALKRFIHWLQSKFKKGMQTIDGIAVSLGIKGDKTDDSSESVEFTNTRGEVIDTQDFDLAIKPILTYMQKDGELVIQLSKIHKHKQKVRGHEPPGIPILPGQIGWKNFILHQPRPQEAVCIILIKNPKYMDYLKIAVDKAAAICSATSNRDIKKTDYQEASDNLKKFEKEVYSHFNDKSIFDPVLFKDVITFNNKLGEFMDNLHESRAMTPESARIINNTDIIDVVNAVANTVLLIQFGINTLTASLKHVYQIDARFRESITDINQLDKFVARCIMNNIPPKYIAYNAYLISSKEIRGSAKINKPIMGQSRVAFLNSKNTVYKIALSSAGIHSNKVEEKVFEDFEKKHIERYLARVLSVTLNHTVMEYEKVYVKSVNVFNAIKQHKLAQKINDEVNNALRDIGVKYRISDIHENNIGMRGNQPVIIDYGALMSDVFILKF